MRVGASNTQMTRDKDKITSRLMFIDFRGSVNVAPRHTQSNGCCGGGLCLTGDCVRLADKENQRAFLVGLVFYFCVKPS